MAFLLTLDPVIQQAMSNRRCLQFSTLVKLCPPLLSALIHEPWYGSHTKWQTHREPIPALAHDYFSSLDIHFLPLCICTYGELWCYETGHVYVMILICCHRFYRIGLYSLFLRLICARTGLHEWYPDGQIFGRAAIASNTPSTSY